VGAGTQANHGDSQNDHSEVFHLNISLLSYAGCREAVRIERGGKTTLFSNKLIRVSPRKTIPAESWEREAPPELNLNPAASQWMPERKGSSDGASRSQIAF